MKKKLGYIFFKSIAILCYILYQIRQSAMQAKDIKRRRHLFSKMYISYFSDKQHPGNCSMYTFYLGICTGILGVFDIRQFEISSLIFFLVSTGKKFQFEIPSQQNPKSQLGQLKMSFQSEQRWNFPGVHFFDSQQCSGCSESTRSKTGNVFWKPLNKFDFL